VADQTEYLRGTSFTDAQAAAPSDPLSGPAVDAEFDRVKIALDTTQQSLDLIQRDDGALQNGIVTADALAPGLAAGLEPTTQWATATSYAVHNTVFYDDGSNLRLYRCLVAHASGTFSVDLASAYWTVLADYTPPAVVGTIAVVDGGTGATNATDARTNLGLGAVATEDILPVAKGGTGSASASAARTALGLAIGSQVQAYHASLASISGLTTLADRMVYTTAADTYAVTPLTSYGRSVAGLADAAAGRTLLGLGTAAVAGLLDEDNMASDSASGVPSQQSVKAYVDAASAAAAAAYPRVIGRTQTAAYASGSGTIPDDTSKPQNTEGTEFMTVSATPTSASSTLRIQVLACVQPNGPGPDQVIGALFVDSDADALAADRKDSHSDGGPLWLVIDYTVASGSTSARTYKFRAGRPSGNTDFNGSGAGAAILGAIVYSSITVTEYP
jgi:hypothetical protein